MIISDEFQFVFVHIPKCGGSSIRNSLKLNDIKTISYGGINKHDFLGKIDYGHITLSYLEKYFSHEYEKILNYFSFVIMRDPYSRIHSSLMQRIKMHKGIKSINIDRNILAEELDETIKYLTNNKSLEQLPAEYIHFQPQIDYIFNNKKQIINNVYLINKLDEIFKDLKTIKNIDLNFNEAKKERLNVSRVHNNRLVQNLHIKNKSRISSIVSKCPDYLLMNLKRLFLKKPQNIFPDIFNSQYVKDFVEDFYRQDICFYNSLIKS